MKLRLESPHEISIKGSMPSKQLQYGSSEHPIEDLNPFQMPPYLISMALCWMCIVQQTKSSRRSGGLSDLGYFDVFVVMFYEIKVGMPP